MNELAENPERRRVQRVRLTKPLRATIDGTRVFIVDVSLRGVRVMHQEEIGGVAQSCVVRAEWDGRPLELHCTIVRTALHRSADSSGNRAAFHSGLTITRAVGVSSLTLRRIIEHHVERALDEQKANARGIPPLAAQSVQTGAPTTFVRHVYHAGRWREVMTMTPEQPDHGFTIAAHTTPAEVEMLRRAYERAKSSNDLAVIRRLAEMSINTSEVVQARRYTP
ncbi:MAG TPA: hypothetical protein VGQ36_26980 [Thermoanaerobaculia bacterium]|jgi:hypothetical protein|nr:hypothetical protein [Thermoanaerobaculia bacterium]